ISVLKPLRQMTLLRNEVEGRQSGSPVFVEARRQQRSSLILKDVAYLIEAELVGQPHAESPLAKYADQFERRLVRGQCHHTPYLGTREFAAWFEPAAGDETPVSLDLDIGQMLFDLVFREDPARHEMTFHRHGADGRHVAQGH